MLQRTTSRLALALLALSLSAAPINLPAWTLSRQQHVHAAPAPISLQITLPTHDLSVGVPKQAAQVFTLALTNHLAVFYSIDPPRSAVTSPDPLWQHGLVGPRHTIPLVVALTRSGQGVLLHLSPMTGIAVTLDELAIAIDLIEADLGLDVDPVAVLSADPDLIGAGANLLGSGAFSAPLGMLHTILTATSLPEGPEASMAFSSALATVLARPAVVKRLAPPIAVGLSVAIGAAIPRQSVALVMTSLTHVMSRLARPISGGRIGRMFSDFGTLIAERRAPSGAATIPPPIPFRLAVAATGASPVQHIQFITIDDPLGAQGTWTSGINDQGDMVGTFNDSAGIRHGFLLHDGAYTTIDDPLAAAGTVVTGINAQGDIVGFYYPHPNTSETHGFLLHRGVFTTIDYPQGEDFFVFGINGHGDIVGEYTDPASSGYRNGFLLHQGVSTAIDADGVDTDASGINDQGDIVGDYSDSDLDATQHGFLLHQGVYTTIDDPLVDTSQPGQGDGASGINDAGDIVGTYSGDSDGTPHGFLLRHGVYTTIDDPEGAQGTDANGINDAGDIVGDFSDAGGTWHGFLRHLSP
jgi:uncharacterized membrane protein